MENVEEIYNFLEEFSKRKPKTIPQELNDYLAYVARTGDPVYQWSLVKCLFKEKLLTVITDFYETTPSIEIPPYPNVDPFNYDIMKNSLLERLDSFTSAPFTVQRICELLTYPRKQYNRIDKFMRAVEKNILVVSTREPGSQRQPEPDNGEVVEPVVNGSDNNSDYNVDVEMEDISWKENNDIQQNSEPQPSSSDAHISVDDIETRLHIQNPSVTSEEKLTREPEVAKITDSVTEESLTDNKVVTISQPPPDTTITISESKESENLSQLPDIDIEMKMENVPSAQIAIPDIKVDDAEMTEQRLKEENKAPDNVELNQKNEIYDSNIQPVSSDESSSDSNCKEENEVKHISEASTSSEESSSSSDNNESSSNSPKIEITPNLEEASNSDSKEEETCQDSEKSDDGDIEKPDSKENILSDKIEPENYSITDVNSEIPQSTDIENKSDNAEILSEAAKEIESIKENKEESDIPEGDKTEVKS